VVVKELDAAEDAEEVVASGGPLAKARRAWTLPKAMAEETSKFAEFLQDSFGSEVLFHVMKTDIDLAAQFFQTWVMHANSVESTLDSEDVHESVAAIVGSTTSFAQAEQS
jgi:hypothetical protein